MQTDGAMNHSHSHSKQNTERPIVDQTRAVGEEVSRLGRVTRDEAKDRLALVKESAIDIVDRGKNAAQRWEHRAENSIQEWPFRSTAIAAGIGLAIGLLLKNSWSSR